MKGIVCPLAFQLMEKQLSKWKQNKTGKFCDWYTRVYQFLALLQVVFTFLKDYSWYDENCWSLEDLFDIISVFYFCFSVFVSHNSSQSIFLSYLYRSNKNHLHIVIDMEIAIYLSWLILGFLYCIFFPHFYFLLP